MNQREIERFFRTLAGELDGRSTVFLGGAAAGLQGVRARPPRKRGAWVVRDQDAASAGGGWRRGAAAQDLGR